TNEYHGELFEYFRNDELDARNFFNFTSSEPPPFKRNLFGGNLGGPIIKNRTFFFFSYEGLRHRQGLDLNSLVLSDLERTSGATDNRQYVRGESPRQRKSSQRVGPESCADRSNSVGEALTGERIGRVLSCESAKSECRVPRGTTKATWYGALEASAVSTPRGRRHRACAETY